MKQWVCGLLKGERLKSTEKISKCKLLCARRHFVHTHTKKNKTLHHMTRPGSILEGFRYTYPTRVRIWVISTITAPNKHISCKSCSSRTRPSVTATMIGRVCKFVCEKKNVMRVCVSRMRHVQLQRHLSALMNQTVSLCYSRERSREKQKRERMIQLSTITQNISCENCVSKAAKDTRLRIHQSHSNSQHAGFTQTKNKTRAQWRDIFTHNIVYEQKTQNQNMPSTDGVCMYVSCIYTSYIFCV